MAKTGIVTPLYATARNKRLSYFGNTVKSVLAQGGEFLWLIVDDGSTDPAARAYLSGLAGVDPRVQVLFRERAASDLHTASNALNRGIAEILQADCAFVCYLHSDDWLLKDSLALRQSRLEAGHDIVFAKTAALVGGKFYVRSPASGSSGRPGGAQMGVHFPHHTTMWRREMLSAMVDERNGELFDPALCFGEDLDVTLFARKLLEQGSYKEAYVDQLLYVWKAYSQDNITSVTKQYEQLRQVKRAFAKNGLSYRREVGVKKYLTTHIPEALRDRLIRALRPGKLPRSAHQVDCSGGIDDELYWFRDAVDPSVSGQIDSLH